MTVRRTMRAVYDWALVAAGPLAIPLVTDGFTRPLPLDMAVLIGLNTLFWLVVALIIRADRRMQEFRNRYPGFRAEGPNG